MLLECIPRRAVHHLQIIDTSSHDNGMPRRCRVSLVWAAAESARIVSSVKELPAIALVSIAHLLVLAMMILAWRWERAMEKIPIIVYLHCSKSHTGCWTTPYIPNSSIQLMGCSLNVGGGHRLMCPS